MKVIIEKYNPEWKTYFHSEYEKLINSLPNTEMVIEHIGSTAVEDLGAKPIVDIMIGLKDFNSANKLTKSMEQLNYVYVSDYEDIMPERRFFRKSEKSIRKFHVHMVGFQTDFWKRHISFRNHLINNKIDREKYHSLKKELSKKEWDNGGEYADAKSIFIREIEQINEQKNTK